MTARPHYSESLTRLEIDLGAVVHNHAFLKGKLAGGAACSAVVKADGYGLGAVPVAGALLAAGCDEFFVATFAEGAEIRAALGPGPRIYVLHGPNGATAKDFTALGLVPVLNSLADIAYWGGAAKDAKNPAILHIDTGMNRLGLPRPDVARVTEDMLAPLDMLCVMSHMACPDTPAHPMNRMQLEAFKAAVAALGGKYRYSLANSAGILLGPEWHFDLARPGCGIYGINPLSNASNPMKPVVTLSGRILQVRDIAEKGTVGYGATYDISPPAKTAVLSVGYADGYFRSLTGRGAVFIGGVKCAVVGRVSMDSIVIDVTALGRTPVPGDWAEIIGPHQTADDVAAEAGTIGYEVLTSLGQRFERTYKRAT